MIAGLEEVTEGRILIGGEDVTDLRPRDRDIAMVFQNYALYPQMTVDENLGFGLKLRRIPKPERQSRVRQVSGTLGLKALSTGGRRSSPAGSGSGWRWGARWCASRRRSSWTSRSRTSTPSCASRCAGS